MFKYDYCFRAAGEGDLYELKRMHKAGFSLDKVIGYAFAGGSLKCLKYAYENGCKWNSLDIINAAGEGHLDCLKYAHENGCKWDASVCSSAAESGHLDCLKYAHENGCKWDKRTTDYSSENGHLECLKYAYENGCNLELSSLVEAALHGQIETFNYCYTKLKDVNTDFNYDIDLTHIIDKIDINNSVTKEPFYLNFLKRPL